MAKQASKQQSAFGRQSIKWTFFSVRQAKCKKRKDCKVLSRHADGQQRQEEANKTFLCNTLKRVFFYLQVTTNTSKDEKELQNLTLITNRSQRHDSLIHRFGNFRTHWVDRIRTKFIGDKKRFKQLTHSQQAAKSLGIVDGRVSTFEQLFLSSVIS